MTPMLRSPSGVKIEKAIRGVNLGAVSEVRQKVRLPCCNIQYGEIVRPALIVNKDDFAFVRGIMGMGGPTVARQSVKARG